MSLTSFFIKFSIMFIWTKIVIAMFTRIILLFILNISSDNHWLYLLIIKLNSFKGNLFLLLLLLFELLFFVLSISLKRFEISFVKIIFKVQIEIWEKLLLTQEWKDFFENVFKEVKIWDVNEFDIWISIPLNNDEMYCKLLLLLLLLNDLLLLFELLFELKLLLLFWIGIEIGVENLKVSNSVFDLL